MGTKNSSTSDVETGFSHMNLIHQNRQRNCMTQDTLDAHLHIRSGVESDKNIKNCERCDSDSYDHCHCSQTTISDEMKLSCKKAWEKCKTAQREASALKELAQVSNVDKYNEVIASETERIDKLKKMYETKSEFLGSSLMKPVYGKKERVDSGKKEKTSKKKKSKDGKGMSKNCRQGSRKDDSGGSRSSKRSNDKNSVSNSKKKRKV